MVKNPPANAGDRGSIPGSGRSPGAGKGNPLQYSCLGILQTEERGPRGHERAGHDLSTNNNNNDKLPRTVSNLCMDHSFISL